MPNFNMKYLITTICACGDKNKTILNERQKIYYLKSTKLFCLKCWKFRRFSFSVIPVIATETKKKIKVALAK